MRSPSRRPLILATLMALVLAVSGMAAQAGLARHDSGTTIRGINVDATTIPQLQRYMDRHKLTSVQLTAFYLQRIKRLNPKLHAVIKVNPWALAEARAADWARHRGIDKPLLGIPVLLKDNINTTGMPTTAGSFALKGSSPRDAFIVKKLRAAGAVIIGKANLSEWANFRSDPSSSGWSGIGGQTNMAYVLDRNPCGSSSGSGVAASASLAAVTVGTETDGSIVCPSGANGIVGIKPTLGLLSRTGIVPISADQDTAGPMTRNVTDAAVMLGVMAGVDPKDPATAAQRGHAFRDYTKFLDKQALKGARIGVWRAGTYGDATADIVEPILADAIEALESQGATVIEGADIDLTAAANEFPALLCEFKTDIATYLETYTRPAYPKTLQDLIDFNNANPDLEGPWDQFVFDEAQLTNGRDAACAQLREDTTPPIRAAFEQVLADNDLDAIVALTNGPAWVTNSDPEGGDTAATDGFATFVGSSTAAAASGWANITVPAGYVDGLPVGISLMGRAWDEPTLIGFAYDFEQATKVRVPPRFIPSIGPAAASAAAGQQRAADSARDGRWTMPPLR